MLWPIALLLIALAALALGAELLVAGATSIAARSRVSPMFIGMTIVGFGTSMPELCTSVLASLRGLDGIAVGNVVGSNTFNLAVILGVTALIRPITVRAPQVRRETGILISVAAIPLLSVVTGGTLGRWAGGAMLLGLAAYLWRTYRIDRNTRPPVTPQPRRRSLAASTALTAAGVVALAWGSSLLVGSARSIASALGMSELTIGLTVVAAGTSMPELITSIVAALRGNMDVAVGNVYGSNVFNMLGILGLTCLVQPQVVSPQVVWLDTPILLLASLAMLPIVTSASRISRLEGLLLCAGYTGYLVVLLTVAPAWFGDA